jgi:putative transposase
VERKFARSALDELWVTDITEHRTREGKVYCCAVMDTCSRRIIGWSIDSVQDAQLVVNALDMAIQHRAGLMPSFGSVGDAFDNAMMKSFWSTMQRELLDRKRCKAHVELSNASFEFIEVFDNRRRRHSQLDYVSPVEFELSIQTA